jgi:hypothetical protein
LEKRWSGLILSSLSLLGSSLVFMLDVLGVDYPSV